MQVSKQEIIYLARLARLHISDEESELVSENLSNILDYMTKLRELENLQEIATDSFNQSENIFRADVSSNRTNMQEALIRSTDSDKEFFRVPKVIK